MANATAGYKTVLQLTGEPITMTEESLSNTGDGKTFEVDASARSIWNWETAVTVEVSDDAGATWTAAPLHTIKYLSGKVVFSASQTGKMVRASGEYLPRFDWARASECSFEQSANDQVTTAFGDTNVSRIYGLSEVSGDLSAFVLLDQPMDGDGGTEDSVRDLLAGRKFIVLSYQPNSDVEYYERAVVMLTSAALEMSVDAVQGASVSFVSASPKSLGNSQVIFEVG